MERLIENVDGFNALKGYGRKSCKEICINLNLVSAAADGTDQCNFCVLQKVFDKLAAYEETEEQENQACNGCKHKGLYEKLAAYGFDCPCYYCKRRKRETDNYEA